MIMGVCALILGAVSSTFLPVIIFLLALAIAAVAGVCGCFLAGMSASHALWLGFCGIVFAQIGYALGLVALGATESLGLPLKKTPKTSAVRDKDAQSSASNNSSRSL